VQTMARGVAEVIDNPRWQSLGSPTLSGIGVSASRAEADAIDAIVGSVMLTDLLAYADTLHQTSLNWLATQSDDDLGAPRRASAHPAPSSVTLACDARGGILVVRAATEVALSQPGTGPRARTSPADRTAQGASARLLPLCAQCW
jgi:hypothetical protein